MSGTRETSTSQTEFVKLDSFLKFCGARCPIKVLRLEGEHFLFLVLPMRLRAE